MNIFALKARLPVALSLAVLAASVAVAQAPSSGAPTSINSAFVKLFGTTGPFTAKVEAQVLDPSQKEKVGACRWILPSSTARSAWRLTWPECRAKTCRLPPLPG